jgi:hypothetical protein
VLNTAVEIIGNYRSDPYVLQDYFTIIYFSYVPVALPPRLAGKAVIKRRKAIAREVNRLIR